MRGVEPVVRALRVAFAALGVAAVVYQLSVSVGGAGFDVVNFFSYFTILSNLASIVVLAVGGVVARDRLPAWWDLVRGAVTTYMVITAVVVLLLLRNVQVGLPEPWVDSTLHEVLPLVMLLDWLVVPPRRHVGVRDALTWLAFPLVWCAYSLLRGPLADDWYAYPFLNPTLDGGYGRVAVYVVVLAPLMAVVALAVAWLGNRARSRQQERRGSQSLTRS